MPYGKDDDTLRIVFDGVLFVVYIMLPILQTILQCIHTFQPPSSSKQEVCNEASISRRRHHTGGKILDFTLSESSKNELSWTFHSPNLSTES